jgi:hypothetical protein
MPTLASHMIIFLLAAAFFMANASSSDDSKSIVMVESEPYVQLNSEQHLAAVDDTDIWLVEFFSPMCGSCTEFKSTWAEVASALNGQVSGLNFRFPCFRVLFVISSLINISSRSQVKLGQLDITDNMDHVQTLGAAAFTIRAVPLKHGLSNGVCCRGA